MPADREIRRIAIDLTPLLLGGENGGAKLMTVELIRNLSRISTKCEFLLLTSEQNDTELAFLDAPNVKRIVIRGARAKHEWIKSGLRRLSQVFPIQIKLKLRSLYSRMVRKSPGISQLRSLRVDLLFCPFTAPFFYDPEIPVIPIVYDIQYHYYPQFFTSEERYHRDKHFRDACRLATRLVCISNYVRDTVIENADVAPERVHTVYIQLSSRIPTAVDKDMAKFLERSRLVSDRFLLYPANFWAHKNHQMLFTAFGMYLAQHPKSDLKLVCTGTPGPRMEYLIDAVRRMGLAEKILFLGYLSTEEFAILIHCCKALIFPSLYEGFGMPVIEAMASERPVLCSNVTSLPEVAGDAALYFDPKRPQTIVQTIQRLETEKELTTKLIEQGRKQVSKFGDAEKMAREYWQVFQEAVASSQYVDYLHGIYPDGWCSEKIQITYQESSTPRRFEIDLILPPWFPGAMTVTLIRKELHHPLVYRIEQGQTLSIQHQLSSEGGFVELLMDYLVQPKALGVAEDTRLLGCLCQGCRIVSPQGTVILHEVGVGAT